MLRFCKESHISQNEGLDIEVAGQYLVFDEKIWQNGSILGIMAFRIIQNCSWFRFWIPGAGWSVMGGRITRQTGNFVC